MNSTPTIQRAPKRQFKAPPATKPKKRQSGQFNKLIEQERLRSGKDGHSRQEELPVRYPSSSLWSYSDKMPVAKKGR